MHKIVSCFKDGLLCLGFGLLTVVALVAFIVFARPLMILVAIVTFGAVVLSCISPRFFRWFDSLGEKRSSQPPAVGPGGRP